MSEVRRLANKDPQRAPGHGNRTGPDLPRSRVPVGAYIARSGVDVRASIAKNPAAVSVRKTTGAVRPYFGERFGGASLNQNA